MDVSQVQTMSENNEIQDAFLYVNQFLFSFRQMKVIKGSRGINFLLYIFLMIYDVNINLKSQVYIDIKFICFEF